MGTAYKLACELAHNLTEMELHNLGVIVAQRLAIAKEPKPDDRIACPGETERLRGLTATSGPEPPDTRTPEQKACVHNWEGGFWDIEGEYSTRECVCTECDLSVRDWYRYDGYTLENGFSVSAKEARESERDETETKPATGC